MKIVVISLADAARRRAQASRQLDSLGLDFDFFDAISGSEAATSPPFDDCDERQWVLRTGRTMTPGELGCFASHRALWQRCIELDEPLLIMEDDFRLLDGFSDALSYLERQVADVGFIRLQSETRGRSRTVDSQGEFRLQHYSRFPHSMMCYGLAPFAAKRLIAASNRIDAPVDVYVKRFWVHGQPLFGIAPYTVTESDLSPDTNIRGRQKCRKSLSVRLQRTASRLGDFLARHRYVLTHPR